MVTEGGGQAVKYCWGGGDFEGHTLPSSITLSPFYGRNGSEVTGRRQLSSPEGLWPPSSAEAGPPPLLWAAVGGGAPDSGPGDRGGCRAVEA